MGDVDLPPQFLNGDRVWYDAPDGEAHDGVVAAIFRTAVEGEYPDPRDDRYNVLLSGTFMVREVPVDKLHPRSVSSRCDRVAQVPS